MRPTKANSHRKAKIGTTTAMTARRTAQGSWTRLPSLRKGNNDETDQRVDCAQHLARTSRGCSAGVHRPLASMRRASSLRRPGVPCSRQRELADDKGTVTTATQVLGVHPGLWRAWRSRPWKVFTTSRPRRPGSPTPIVETALVTRVYKRSGVRVEPVARDPNLNPEVTSRYIRDRRFRGHWRRR